jgi:Ca-activated chloride channel family protein
MNAYTFLHYHGLRVPLVCIPLIAAGIAAADQARLDAALATPVLMEGAGQNAYLRVAVTGQPLPGEADRTPVNLAIVLDRSGSMQGHKIAAARDAAKLAIDRLRADDIISVIAYESTVEVLVPATRATDTAAIYQAIDRVYANGNTALFAGVSKGAGEIRKFLSRDRVNRIILLSDGLANVGPSSPGELGDLGTALGKEGITVSTMGLGLDYNEDLMTKLAMTSDGNHMFVENAVDLERAYALEFGDALSVVAQDVEMRLTCSQGVRPVRVLGRESTIDGQVIRTSLNQLGSGQTRYVIVELDLPAHKADDTAAVADVAIRYLDMNSGSRVEQSKSVVAQFTNSADIVEKRTDPEIMASVVQQIGAERASLALTLRDQGQIDEARALLFSNRSYLFENSVRYNNEQLRKDAETNDIIVNNLDPTNYVKSRKLGLEYDAKTKRQQSVGLEQKK